MQEVTRDVNDPVSGKSLLSTLQSSGGEFHIAPLGSGLRLHSVSAAPWDRDAGHSVWVKRRGRLSLRLRRFRLVQPFLRHDFCLWPRSVASARRRR